MKNLIILLLFANISFMGSCKKEVPHYKVGVNLFEDFEKDSIQIFIDGKEKLNKKVQTNHSLGIALTSGFTEEVKEGKHILKIIINDSVRYKNDFNVTKNLDIGIFFHRKKQTISVTYRDFHVIPLD